LVFSFLVASQFNVLNPSKGLTVFQVTQILIIVVSFFFETYIMVSFILFIPLGKAQYDEIFDDIPKVEESKNQSHYPPKGYTE
jgi:hypothetical protein